jgi:lysophospholipid acyltransferase (LPLAT)-like uncharacterized protein
MHFPDYKIFRPFLRKLLVYSSFPLAGLLKAWEKTIFFENDPWPIVIQNKPALLAIYHGELLPLLFYALKKTDIGVLVSQHSDGEIIARVVQYLGLKVIRGSTDYGKNRGGFKALLSLKKSLEKGLNIAITVDGPKGPCCKVSKGILYLSWLTQRPIIPVRVFVEKKITLKSWDRFIIPLPGTKTKIFIGKPLIVKHKQELSIKWKLLETNLRELRNLVK